MKLCSISDVHISPNFPERLELFKSFCHSKEVSESDIVVLLGDIFDHMAGQKKKYLNQYSDFFNILTKLIKSGKRLIVVEGNHDFHTNEIFSHYFKENLTNEEYQRYQHLKDDEIITFSNTKLYIGHGDVLDYDNLAYKRWKSIYSSKLFEIIMKYLFPYFFIENLGRRASKNSKKRGSKTFNYKESEEKYREGFRILSKKLEYDIAITGHTHIKDTFEYNNKLLLNNGFFPATKSFIYIDLNSKKGEVVKLVES